MALTMILFVALGVGYYVGGVKKATINTSASSQCQAIGSNLLNQISAADNSLVITNNAPMSDSNNQAVTPAPLESTNPLCCTQNGRANCTSTRRTLLCGSYTSAINEAQNVKGAATWAQNLYLYCTSSGSAGCGLTNQAADSLCSGDGLDFDEDAEIALLGEILPSSVNLAASTDSYGRPAPSGSARPARVRLKIEPISLNRRNVKGGCNPMGNGLEANPPYGLNSNMGYNVQIITYYNPNPSQSVNAQNPLKSCPAISAGVVFPLDHSNPTMTNTLGLVNAGPDGNISATETSGTNTDNESIPTSTSYYRDGSVRSNASCSCPVTAGVPPAPGTSYCSGWDKVGMFAVSSEPGSTFICSSSLTSTPNQSCDTVLGGVVADNTLSTDQGTRIGLAWSNPLPEGTQLSIATIDAGGNISPEVAQVSVSPGYCPPTSTYCADGSQTGTEAGPNITAAPGAAGACTADPTYPAYTPPISCRPHSGCGDAVGNLCPQGTRTGQNCPATNTYCTAGVNKGAYACAAGIDCTTDARCGKSVCDDCGQGTCANSTIPVGNNCPASSNYCSGATVGGAGIFGLPTDTCGNACPAGTRSGVGCPSPSSVCIGTSTGSDDCGQACAAATKVCCVPSCPNPATVCSGTALGGDGCGGTCSGTGTMACAPPPGGGGGGCPGGQYPDQASCDATVTSSDVIVGGSACYQPSGACWQALCSSWTGWSPTQEYSAGHGGAHRHCLHNEDCSQNGIDNGKCRSVICNGYCCSEEGISCCAAGLGEAGCGT